MITIKMIIIIAVVIVVNSNKILSNNHNGNLVTVLKDDGENEDDTACATIVKSLWPTASILTKKTKTGSYTNINVQPINSDGLVEERTVDNRNNTADYHKSYNKKNMNNSNNDKNVSLHSSGQFTANFYRKDPFWTCVDGTSSSTPVDKNRDDTATAMATMNNNWVVFNVNDEQQYLMILLDM